MKDYDKSKNHHILSIRGVNNIYGRGMSQKFPVNGFKWVKETSQFSEDFIESYNEENDEVNFLEVDV